MIETGISDLSRSFIKIVWYFGPQGLNGECCGNITMPEFIALDKISVTPDCTVQDVGNILRFTKSGATWLCWPVFSENVWSAQLLL